MTRFEEETAFRASGVFYTVYCGPWVEWAQTQWAAQTNRSEVMAEANLQRTIVEMLRWDGWNVVEFAKPGGHGALGGAVPPGHPDLLCIRDGVHVWFELKMPDEHSTPIQQDYQDKLRASGDFVAEVHSPEEVLAALKNWNLASRASLT